jgi:hypothetical protein
MASFGSIYLRLLNEQNGQPPLLSVDTPENPDDQMSQDTFRAGLHMRNSKEQDQTFWNELKKLAGSNRSGLAKMLQISPSIVGRWPQVIDNLMKKITSDDAHHDGVKKPEMVGTGNQATHSSGQKPAYAMQGTYGDTNAPQLRGPF